MSQKEMTYLERLRQNLPPIIRDSKRFFLVSANKVPLTVAWGKPENQMTLAEIENIWKPGQYAAFCVTGDPQFLFIDFDHVLDAKTWRFVNPAAKEFFDSFRIDYFTCYCEISISGTGIHAFMLPTPGKFPSISGSKHRGRLYFDENCFAEFFYATQARYCLLTGNNSIGYTAHPSVPEGAEADAFLEKLLPKINVTPTEGNVFTAAAAAEDVTFSDSADSAGDSSFNRIRAVEMLKFISPDCDYDTWSKIGMILKTLGFDVETWDAWSRPSFKYNEGECVKKWESFSASGTLTIATLCELAKQGGYSDAALQRKVFGTGTHKKNVTFLTSEQYKQIFSGDLSDYNNARRLAAYGQNRIRYVIDADQFATYEGGIWRLGADVTLLPIAAQFVSTLDFHIARQGEKAQKLKAELNAALKKEKEQRAQEMAEAFEEVFGAEGTDTAAATAEDVTPAAATAEDVTISAMGADDTVSAEGTDTAAATAEDVTISADAAEDVTPLEVAVEEDLTKTERATTPEGKAAEAKYLTQKKLIGYFCAIEGHFKKRKDISNAIALLKGVDSIIIRQADLDTHKNLLCAANGVVDLETGKRYPCEPKLLMTQQAGAAYRPNFYCDLVDEFFAQIQPEEATRAALLRFLGYGITGYCSEEKALFIDGTGGNGKGTLTKLIMASVGDYACVFPIEGILHNKTAQDANAATPAFNVLANARLAISEEIPARAKLNAAKFKQLTGGDRIYTRRLHQEASYIDPKFSMLLSGNNLPEIGDAKDIGLLRRILRIPFTQDFTANPDVTLKARLSTQDALSGMLTRLVEQAVAWHKDGLIITAEMTQAARDYVTAQDYIREFISEKCVFVEDSIPRKEFLTKLREEYPVETRGASDRALTEMIEKQDGISYRRGTGGGYAFYGVGWQA